MRLSAAVEHPPDIAGLNGFVCEAGRNPCGGEQNHAAGQVEPDEQTNEQGNRGEERVVARFADVQRRGNLEETEGGPSQQ